MSDAGARKKSAVFENSDGSNVFYAVNIPLEDQSDEFALIFTDKSDALKSAKKHKGARFKAFATREDAISFAKQLPESTPLVERALAAINSPELSSNVGVEKPCPFKAPRSQEMVKLRKMIECGDAESFNQTVWQNPRFLISSGDTPTIMQEGFRYNALHVAAKFKQANMCKLILSTIQDEKFILLLFNDDSPEIIKQRKTFLVDLYLNMPDKGLGETPLHFGSKFGCLKAVQVLLSHPSCDRSRVNKYGKTSFDVICERFGGKELKRDIEALYEARYFIPIMRADGNSFQAIVGQPFSIEDSVLNSANQPSSPKNPLLVIKAKAGPMPLEDAQSFYRRLKAPTTPLSGSDKDIRLVDSDKGLERIGRKLAEQFKVPWSEYWPFLSAWCNLVHPEGLAMLENHLKQMYINVCNEMRARIAYESPAEVSSCCSSVFENSLSPISQLCRQLEDVHLNCTPNSVCSPLSNRGNSCSPTFYGLHGSPPSSSPHSSFTARAGGVVRTLSYESPELRQQIFWNSKRKHSIEMASKKPRGLNFHINEVSETLSNRLMDVISEDNILNTSFDDLVNGVLPAYEKLLPVVSSELRLTVHRDVAEQTSQKLNDNLRTKDIQLACEICTNVLSNESLLLDEVEDVELESPLPFRRRSMNVFVPNQQLEMKKNHVKCILKQIHWNLSRSTNDTQCSSCTCTWNLHSFMACSSPTSSSSSFNGNNSTINKTIMDVEESGGSAASEDEWSEDEFVTPPCSETDSRSSSPLEMHTPEEGLEIFIQGFHPSKSDLDVLNALQSVSIDPVRYPHTCLWKHLVNSVPKEVTKSWMSPKPSNRRRSVASTVLNKTDPLQLTPVKSHTLAYSRSAPRLRKDHFSEPGNMYDNFSKWADYGHF